MSSRLIVDVQGFKSENNFIPKELAAYDEQQLTHSISRISFPFNSLSPNLQRENKWLSESFHGFDWKAGFTTLYQFKNIISTREKANYLRKYTNKEVLELDEQPALPTLEPKCFYHLRSSCKCALPNVFY